MIDDRYKGRIYGMWTSYSRSYSPSFMFGVGPVGIDVQDICDRVHVLNELVQRHLKVANKIYIEPVDAADAIHGVKDDDHVQLFRANSEWWFITSSFDAQPPLLPPPPPLPQPSPHHHTSGDNDDISDTDHD